MADSPTAPRLSKERVEELLAMEYADGGEGPSPDVVLRHAAADLARTCLSLYASLAAARSAAFAEAAEVCTELIGYEAERIARGKRGMSAPGDALIADGQAATVALGFARARIRALGGAVFSDCGRRDGGGAP